MIKAHHALTRPSNDFEDAIALIDLIDNPDAREAVKAALSESFEPGEKKELWAMLTVEQREKLKG
ncbi:MAG: hypothetical protein ACRC62_03810 [Microcoleus sp.]